MNLKSQGGNMKAAELVIDQYFSASGCGDGNAFFTLPREYPDKVRGRLVFVYSPDRIFHSKQVRIFALNDEVTAIESFS